MSNPRFWFSHHRCRPTYNTVTGLSASGSPSISLLRVSLGNCLIKPQVQGLLSIHLILEDSSTRWYLLFCIVAQCAFSGWGLIFFLHLHSIYKRILHCNEQLMGGKDKRFQHEQKGLWLRRCYSLLWGIAVILFFGK